MTLNCIWLRGSNSGDLGFMEYPFIVIILRSTQTESGSTCDGYIYGSDWSVCKLFALDRYT